MYRLSFYNSAGKKWENAREVEAVTSTVALNQLLGEVEVAAARGASVLVLVEALDAPAMATYRLWPTKGRVVQECVRP